MIGICTDSNAQLAPELRDRLGIEVVPLTVTIDGIDYLEGVDIDTDDFWGRFADHTPSVATAAPSPGRFLQAWTRLADRGASQIVSIHIGSRLSGTLNAAMVAEGSAPVPVRLVDTGSASFVVGCAAWAAADAAGDGADAAEVAAAASSVASACGNVFVVGALDLARAGGRLSGDAIVEPGTVPVLALAGNQMQTVGECGDVSEAARLMADHLLGHGSTLRVGVGASDPSSFPIADALTTRLEAVPDVELVRYRVGPSVGVHTGPGTAGAVFHPRN